MGNRTIFPGLYCANKLSHSNKYSSYYIRQDFERGGRFLRNRGQFQRRFFSVSRIFTVNVRPTPPGPVRWRYWPSKDQPGTQIFCNFHPGPCPSEKLHGASFLGQQSIRTRQILPWILSVSAKNWPIYVTRLRTISLHGRAITIRIKFLAKLLQTWPEQCG
jgi:hypothetical protein